MNNLRNFTLLLLLFVLGGNVNAQVGEQIIVHMAPGSDNVDLTDLANRWNAVVVEPLIMPDGLIGVIQPVSYPFTNPFNPLQQIVNVNQAKKHIIDEDIEGDGGVVNQLIGGQVTVGNSASCYSGFSSTGDLMGNTVRVGVFDSGVSWKDANDIGYDFNPVEEVFNNSSDNNGHGTHVATIMHDTYSTPIGGSNLGAVEYVFGNPLNNGAGGGTLADLILSLEYAILDLGDAGPVNVYNCSFSYMGLPESFEGNPMNGYLQSFQDVDPLYLLMQRANPLRSLFICAAGNDEMDIDDPENDLINFPASFDLENIITVASHDCQGDLSTFSNYGNKSVDIAAPGEEIVSYDHNMNLVAYSGTSQATAFVSGAAVILGSRLSTFSAVEVKCAIMNGAKHSPYLQGKMVSNGVLDVDDAILELLDCKASSGGGSTNAGGAHGREKAVSGNVMVSPNPFTTDIMMSFDLKSTSDVNIKVYNTAGQIVHTVIQAGQIGTNEISLNFDNLVNNNYYILRLETNEFTSNTKIIKTK